MTTITFGQGFVGFAFEHLDNTRHHWVNGQYQLRTDQPNYRNVLTNERDKRSKWQDHRNLRWFWSPDGTPYNRVYCENLTEAIALVISTWHQAPPEEARGDLVVVFGDLASGIENVIGPFATRDAASIYGDQFSEGKWSIQVLEEPDDG